MRREEWTTNARQTELDVTEVGAVLSAESWRFRNERIDGEDEHHAETDLPLIEDLLVGVTDLFVSVVCRTGNDC